MPPTPTIKHRFFLIITPRKFVFFSGSGTADATAQSTPVIRAAGDWDAS
jgi:hypothetical protein